jgi:hypothetical protein
MRLREVTRTVIARVEDVSGCPVVVSEDASLKLWRRSRRKPSNSCRGFRGSRRRLFAVPAAARVDLASTGEGRQVIQRLLNAPDGPGKKLKLPPETIEAIRDQLGLTADGTISPENEPALIADQIIREKNFARVRKIGAELAAKKWQPAP